MSMVHFSRPGCLLLLLVCLSLIQALTSAYLFTGRPVLRKRTLEGNGFPPAGSSNRKLFFKPPLFQSVTVMRRHQSGFLECEAGGSPVPSLHWLKDGQRVQQGVVETVYDDSTSYENELDSPDAAKLRLSSTRSRLYLDCPSSLQEGEYTCVAETPYTRKTQSTVLRIDGPPSDLSPSCMVRRSGVGSPARIVMWTVSRLEYEGVTVQLFCRATGSPPPTVTWYDSRNNSLPLGQRSQYSMAANGDLIIQSIAWFNNMGMYKCVAENELGLHSAETFLYPTPRQEGLAAL